MPHKYKVVLVDYNEVLCPPQGWEGEVLSEADAEWIAGLHRSTDAVAEVAHDADVILIQTVRRLVTRQVIKGLSDRCRGIVRMGIGYDTVDVAAATERGIPVLNIPGTAVHEVAEHALAILLAVARRVAVQDRWIRSGRWDRTGLKPIHRVWGRVLGLIGFGRVARELARRASGIGLKVIAHDPYVSAEEMSTLGVDAVGLDDLLQRADYVSIHTPLNPSTRHLVGERELGLLKPGAILVNTSRGPVVDEAALVDALREGRLDAAALDVFENEPPEEDSPLRRMDNVVLTPHVAWYSEESVAGVYRCACEIAIQLIKGEWPASVVNPDVRPRWLREA